MNDGKILWVPLKNGHTVGASSQQKEFVVIAVDGSGRVFQGHEVVDDGGVDVGLQNGIDGAVDTGSSSK